MAWTAPKTWVGNEVPTASALNTHLRDNLLETMPAKATDEGQIFVGNGNNSITTRVIQAARITTSQSTSSTSYTDLATVGPEVTVTHGVYAVIFISAALNHDTTDSFHRMSWAMSGSNVRAAQDSTSIMVDGIPAGQVLRLGSVDIHSGLTPGTTTFTAKYRVQSGTCTFSDRFIGVIPL